MKQIIKKVNWLKTMEVVAVGAVMLLPFAALALPQPNCQDLNGVNCSATSFNGLLKTVINWLLGIAFLVAVLFLIIGGFWYITAAGNEETAEKGKNTVINAIIGIVIIILSYVIVSVVSNLVTTTNSTAAP